MYAYALNNPLRFIDPLGLDCYQICGMNGQDCGEYSQELYDKVRKDKSVIVAGGKIYARNRNGTRGDQLGTVRRIETGMDDRGDSAAAELGARADASNKSIALFAGGSLVVGGGAALAPFAAQAVNELALGPATGRLLYSGAQKAAAVAAAASGAERLIEESPLGSHFAQVAPRLIPFLQTKGWNILSRMWAAGASGNVRTFVGDAASETSTFIRVELPVLIENTNTFQSGRFLQFPTP